MPRSFITGNKVWLDSHNLKTNVKSKKLAPKQYGPFKIVKQVSPIAYKIKLPPSMKIHDVFYIDLLIPFTEMRAYSETHSHPPPELIDREEEYEVEEILNDCINRRKKTKQYFVR
jgi:hypothetical protein